MIEMRPETGRDIPAIRTLTFQAFDQPDEADLVDRLRAAGDCALSLVACEGGQVCGHVLLSPLRASFPALGLAPLSVAPGFQGRGIGTALLHDAIRRAETDGWQAIFILGDPGYYARVGFSVADAADYATPYSGPYFMVRFLGNHTPSKTGTIDYPPAFSALV